MHSLILELRTEHGAIIRSLYRLSTLAATLGSDQGENSGPLLAVMASLTEWPDRLHHPKEELIFDRICDRAGVAPPLIRRLRSEHHTLVHEGIELVHALERWSRDETGEAGGLRRQVRNYVRHQRWHIIQEESGLYRLAESLLSESDWTALEDRVQSLECAPTEDPRHV